MGRDWKPRSASTCFMVASCQVRLGSAPSGGAATVKHTFSPAFPPPSVTSLMISDISFRLSGSPEFRKPPRMGRRISEFSRSAKRCDSVP